MCSRGERAFQVDSGMPNNPASDPAHYARIPGGRHGLTPELVSADQRAREHAAMVRAVAELGYEATTVENVISRAGVSRRTFYEHYTNKLECFLAACDEVLADWMHEGTLAYQAAVRESDDATIAAHLRAGLRALFERVNGDPVGARVIFIDLLNSGSSGVQRLERTLKQLESAVERAFQAPDGSCELPAAMATVIVGGVLEVVTLRLRHGRVEELPSLVEPLIPWMESYLLPDAPEVIAHPDRQRAGLPHATEGPSGSRPDDRDGRERGAVPLWRGGSARPVAIRDPRARILDVVPELVSERGYARLSVADICKAARVSHNTFRREFASKEAAFLEAYRDGGQQTLENSMVAVAAAADWRSSIRAGMSAELQFLAGRPAFARIGFLEVYAAGPEALKLREMELHMWTLALKPGYRETKGPPPHGVVSEAIAGGIYQLIRAFLQEHPPEQLPCLLPAAVETALAPFLGADAALAVALEPIGRA
jgi:AcrR family transcriptional regulator